MCANLSMAKQLRVLNKPTRRENLKTVTEGFREKEMNRGDSEMDVEGGKHEKEKSKSSSNCCLSH